LNPKYSLVQTPEFERNFRKLRSELPLRLYLEPSVVGDVGSLIIPSTWLYH
jgi:hypothetical protein